MVCSTIHRKSFSEGDSDPPLLRAYLTYVQLPWYILVDGKPISNCDDLYHTPTFKCMHTHNSTVEGATKLKFVPFCSS